MVANSQARLPMHQEALCTYIDEIFEGYVGEEMRFGHCVDHLAGLMITISPDYDGYDTPMKSILYLVSNFVHEKLGRSTSSEEDNQLHRLTGDDAKAIARYAAEHPLFESVQRLCETMVW